MDTMDTDCRPETTAEILEVCAYMLDLTIPMAEFLGKLCGLSAPQGEGPMMQDDLRVMAEFYRNNKHEDAAMMQRIIKSSESHPTRDGRADTNVEVGGRTVG